MVDKLRMSSEDIVSNNIEKIAKLFPSCVVESQGEDGKLAYRIDFEALKTELSELVVPDGGEKYQFTWPGKTEAKILANSPINMCLRPCPDESVDYDNTKNVYIKGDNLDVLKILRETYYRKVKMIYIDPPYNTGSDAFVYGDDYRLKLEEYSKISGDYSEEGYKLTPNLGSSGRLHTDWLNMMYPRLRLARDFLTDDGVIFISIDDNEQANLKKMCDEIFGEHNFITSLVWAAGRKNDSKYVSVSHEYVLCYVKSIQYLTNNKIIWRERKQGLDDIYQEYEQLKKKYGTNVESIEKELNNWYKGLNANDPAKNHKHYNKVDVIGIFFAADVSWPGGGGPKYEVLHPVTHKPVKIPSRGWIYPTKERMQEMIDSGKIYFGPDESKVPCIKSYLKDNEYSAPYSVFYKDGRAATKRLRDLMGAMVFQNPKDEEIIKSLIQFTLSDKNSIIMDYFSGSATTAHAVMELNAEDGGNRQFILVQIPEKCDESSEAFKSGYKTICELGIDRIRRAGSTIKKQYAQRSLDGNNYKLDTGFRVFNCDTSNMKDTYYAPEETNQQKLDDLIDNVKKDRRPEDLLFQSMLECSIPLSASIKEESVDGRKVFVVNNGELVACFDTSISEKVVEFIAKSTKSYAIIRDASIDSDSTATNFEQIFKTYNPNIERRVL